MINLEEINQAGNLDIAIIGMSGRFPQARNLDAFWQNLRDGVESISFFSEQELESAGIDPVLLKDSNYVKASAVLEDIELFDASFFDYSPRIAEIMDPQHRIFLECAWEALENSGYDSEIYDGLISVYGGASISSYFLLNLFTNSELLKVVGLDQIRHNSRIDNLTTRVAYKLNLKGSAITIQTGCSSSLVAAHLACQSLLDRECDLALAGGISITPPQKSGYLYQEGGIFSPDGHCRTFDAKAQGTVGGNGVGIVVLKRLAEAIADRDHIHAVIKGSAINNDGSLKVGYTAPSIEGQAKVIAEAMAIARIRPETVSYVEAHGTGTPLGDPIEIAALTKSFRAKTSTKNFCAIGSVKTNIGHLDTAAGVAGLIKTTLALKHRQIPPSLHFEQSNPKIDFANSPFYVNHQLSEWQTNGNPRRAGVSSFGIGGTNAHIILEEAPVVESSEPSRPWQLLLLSAKTSEALEAATANLVQYLQSNQDSSLADVAYTLQVGRRGFTYRQMLVCQSRDDALQALENLEPQRVFTCSTESRQNSVVFMFPGQGTQYVNMALELYQTEPIFTAQIDRCCELLKPHLGLDLRHVLFPSEAKEESATQQLQRTHLAQPALFVIEYALARLWMMWGVYPEAMIGHSVGEYVAACLADVFSLEDALALVAARGQLMQQLPGGAMLAVPLSEQEVRPLLGDQLSLAAINAPERCVVSGPNSAINNLQKRLIQRGVECRPLHTSHAFHSPMMEPIIEPLTQQLEKVNFNQPKIPFLSNLTGTWITAAEATDPHYWTKHLRQTVRFAAGIAQLLQEPNRLLLEVGPGRTLSILAKQQTQEQLVLCSTRHPYDQKSDLAFLLHTLGRLWLSKIQIDWSGFYDHEKRYRLPLPTYPFERKKYWIEFHEVESFERKFQPKPTTSEIWNSLKEGVQAKAVSGLKEFDELTYLENKHFLDQLCLAYINHALKCLGVFSNPDEKYSLEELLEQCQIIPHYRQLFCRWLEVLVERGHLQREKEMFTSFTPWSTDSVKTLLKETRVRCADTPQSLDVIRQCGENLLPVLRGAKKPLTLFTSSAGKKLATEEAENSDLEFSLYNYYKEILRTGLEQIVSLLPSNVNLRILEIGGGKGIATEGLLSVLSAQQTQYTFTDISPLSLQLAREKFSSYPFVEYRFLDIEKSPIEQGYSTHSFDVVVAVNVLHVTRKLRDTLEHVRSLLAPGGFFLLWEITKSQLKFDICEGLLMNPLEDENRSQGNPFLSKEQWQKVLRDNGFVEVVAFSTTEAFGHKIFAARASESTTCSTWSAFTKSIESNGKPGPPQVLFDKKPNIADWFYVPSWKRSLPPQSFNPDVRPGNWLVFVDECGLGESLVQQLSLNSQEVVTVSVGEQFGRQNNSFQFTLNPRRREDYSALVKELHSLGKLPNRIVHCWSVTPDRQERSTFELLETSGYLGFYSLLFLAQALGEQSLEDSVEVGIVSNNMQEVAGSERLCPEKALVLGPCKVIPLEYPNIFCRSIDIVLSESGTSQEERLISQLLTELTSPISDRILAYRGNYRWVQDFDPVRLEGAVEDQLRLRHEGVYLITGGLGGVGLALAEYLAQSVSAKLVLTGRSAFPDRDEWDQWLATHDQEDRVSCKIRKLQALESLDAEVMFVSADVANLEQMSIVLDKANQRFGQIHGVIHAASVPGGGVVQLTTPESVANSLAPKVTGALVLDFLFRNTELDFFVLCSALSSLHGTLGMVDYTAENDFLDAFAHYLAAQRNHAFTISINWERWLGVGMAIDVAARHKAITGEELKRGMTSEEGIEAFRRILCSSVTPQLIVSTQDFETLIQQKSLSSSEDKLLEVNRSRPTHSRPKLGNAYVPASNEIEKIVTGCWQQILGIDQIGIHDNFFELGGDSLMSVQLIALLKKELNAQISVVTLYERPTINSLAEALNDSANEKVLLESNYSRGQKRRERKKKRLQD